MKRKNVVFTIRLILLAALCGLILTYLPQRLAAQEATKDIVTNGDFSDGLTAWTWMNLEDGNMTPYAQAGELYVDILSPGTETWYVMFRQMFKPVVNGYTYTISFDARATEARTIYAKLGLLPDPYTTYGGTTFDLTTEMQNYQYSFVMNEATDPCAVLEFQLGASTADVYMDNIQVITSTDAIVPPPADLPTTQSRTGHPLRYHADERGMVVGSATLAQNVQCSAAYSAIMSTEFNGLTPGNEMKMGNLQPSRGVYQFGDADVLVDYAEANDMEVHGHVLVWHSQQPGWLESGTFTRDEMIDILYDHIDTVVGRYEGRIAVWDVVNEAIDDGTNQLRDSFWKTRIGDDYIDLAFQRTRQADPNVVLLYNDYNIATVNAKSTAVYNMVADMVARGIPIDGVGMQMHLIEGSPPDPASVAANIARFADLGLEIYITEIDVRILEPATDAQLEHQAQIYRDMLHTCLAASNCSHFTTWDFGDAYSWIPSTFPGYGDAHLFDEDFVAKPAYHALIEELSLTAVPTPTIPPTMTPGTCTVNYAVPNQWATGATVDVTITNNGASAIDGWTLEWTFPGNQQISSLWNGTYTQSGAAVSVTNANHTKTIAANGGTVNFGFNLTYSGTNDIPTYFVLNGSPCNGGQGPTPTTVPPTSVPPTSIPPTSTPVTVIPPTSTPVTVIPPTSTPVTVIPPTPTPTTVPPTTGPGGCAVSYAIQNDWGSGATVSVTIQNNGESAVNGWTLTWTFPGNQLINNLWSGSYTQSGASISVSNAAWNATIGGSGGTVSFGFNLSYSGTNAAPTNFALNGTACR